VRHVALLLADGTEGEGTVLAERTERPRRVV
jgi:hypothetical protein